MLIFVGTQAGPHREKAEFSLECLKDGVLMWCKQDLGRMCISRPMSVFNVKTRRSIARSRPTIGHYRLYPKMWCCCWGSLSRDTVAEVNSSRTAIIHSNMMWASTISKYDEELTVSHDLMSYRCGQRPVASNLMRDQLIFQKIMW